MVPWWGIGASPHYTGIGIMWPCLQRMEWGGVGPNAPQLRTKRRIGPRKRGTTNRPPSDASGFVVPPSGGLSWGAFGSVPGGEIDPEEAEMGCGGQQVLVVGVDLPETMLRGGRQVDGVGGTEKHRRRQPPVRGRHTLVDRH